MRVETLGHRLTIPAPRSASDAARPSGTSRPATKKARVEESSRVQANTPQPAAKGQVDKGKGRAGVDEGSRTGGRHPHQSSSAGAVQSAAGPSRRRALSPSRVDLLPFDTMQNEPNEEGVIDFEWDEDAKGALSVSLPFRG